jgi:hypothetical protein
VVTGNPHYDYWGITWDNNNRKFGKRKSFNSINVLYQSQPILEDFGSLTSGGSLGYTQHTAFRDLINVFGTCEFSNVNLIIRKHLREKKNGKWGNASEAFSYDPRITISFEEESAEKLDLTRFDLVVSHFSTTLIESIHSGIPSISYQPGPKTADNFIANMLGLSLPAYDLTGLKNVILEASSAQYLLTMQQRTMQLKRENIFFSQGDASQKVLSVARDLILN